MKVHLKRHYNQPLNSFKGLPFEKGIDILPIHYPAEIIMDYYQEVYGISTIAFSNPIKGKKFSLFNLVVFEEKVRREHYKTLECVQKAFDEWQYIYNYERPHDALKLEVPATRYRLSTRAMPYQIMAPEYDDGDLVRQVDMKGMIRFKGDKYVVGRAFYNKAVALRPDLLKEAVYKVYYRHQLIKIIDCQHKTQHHASIALQAE